MAKKYLPIGHVSKRKDGNYKKVAPGKWEKTKDPKTAGAVRAFAHYAPPTAPKEMRAEAKKKIKSLAKLPKDKRKAQLEKLRKSVDKARPELEAIETKMAKGGNKLAALNAQEKKRLNALRVRVRNGADVLKHYHEKGEGPGVEASKDQSFTDFSFVAAAAEQKKAAKAQEKVGNLPKPTKPEGAQAPGKVKSKWEYTPPGQAQRQAARKKVESLRAAMKTNSYKPYSIDEFKEKHKEEADVVDAITLFTNGNVASVKDPTKAKNMGTGTVNSTVRMRDPKFKDHRKPWVTPNTPETYKKAHDIMVGLAHAPRDSKKQLWRGMVGVGQELRDQLVVGAEMDLGPVASFSSSKSVANKFTSKYNGFLFKLKSDRGTDISDLSHFKGEKETVVGGKIRVTKVDQDSVGRTVVHCEAI